MTIQLTFLQHVVSILAMVVNGIIVGDMLRTQTIANAYKLFQLQEDGIF